MSSLRFDFTSFLRLFFLSVFSASISGETNDEIREENGGTKIRIVWKILGFPLIVYYIVRDKVLYHYYKGGEEKKRETQGFRDKTTVRPNLKKYGSRR